MILFSKFVINENIESKQLNLSFNVKTILSVDGGGIRGVLPAAIISHLERRLQTENKNPELRIADFFDLMSGTSAGGILTCLYLTPKNGTIDNRPKYTAKEILDFYTELGPLLFKRTPAYLLKSGFGLFRSRYSEDALYEFSNKIVGDAYISGVLKDCLITAYDLSSRKALLFSRYSTSKYGDMADYKLCDIVKSTSAAPSYFIPCQIFAKDKSPRHLVDGGVYANNPAMCTIVEAKKLWPSTNVSDYFMISAGTGKVIKPYHYHKTRHFGYIHWLNPILDILMSSVAETVDYQAQQLFNINDVPDNYIRIEPPLLTADIRIDKASKSNIRKLESAARHYIDHNSQLFDTLCKRLSEKVVKND